MTEELLPFMDDDEIKPLLEIVDDAAVWRPHRFQQQALDSRARFTFMPKGWRGGFSSFMPSVLEEEMIRCGPGNETLSYFVIAPTLKVATKHGSIQTTHQLLHVQSDGVHDLPSD